MQKNLLNFEGFSQYLESNLTVALPISEAVDGKIVLEPVDDSLTLVCPANAVPDLSLYPIFDAKLRFDSLSSSSKAHLKVSAPSRMFEAYLFLMNIVFLLEQDQDFPSSFHQALDNFSYLVEKQGILSSEKQTGLFGELLMLDRLTDSLGFSTALEGWQGPRSGEHDFTLSEFDLEVKTTASESRTHRIGSLQQLLPVLNRDLYFLSIQLTTSSSVEALSLSKLASRLLNESGKAELTLRQKLNSAGWRDEHNHLYNVPWVLREEPLVFPVGSMFPTLTQSNLSLAEELRPRIYDISYRINLDSLDGGVPLDTFIGERI